ICYCAFARSSTTRRSTPATTRSASEPTSASMSQPAPDRSSRASLLLAEGSLLGERLCAEIGSARLTPLADQLATGLDVQHHADVLRRPPAHREHVAGEQPNAGVAVARDVPLHVVELSAGSNVDVPLVDRTVGVLTFDDLVV